MNLSIYLPLISAIFVSILGFFIYSKNKKSRLNFVFLLFSFSTFVWFFGTFMMFLSRTESQALFWDKFVYVGVIFIPALVYNFGMTFLKKDVESKKSIILGYLLAALFLVSNLFSPYFIDGIFVYYWGMHSKAQILHHFFLVFFVAYLFMLFKELFISYKKNLGLVKEQIKYVLVALLFLTAGSLAFLPAYGIGIYPFAYVSGVIFAAILAYAIIVHRLMDIKLVMRRSSVYLLSLVSVTLPAFGAKAFIISFSPEIGKWTDIIILVVSISLFPAIRAYYYRLANRYFFSSLYDTKQVIENISDSLSSTLDVKNIYAFVSGALLDIFHSKSIGILTYDEKKKEYILQHNVGLNVGKQKKFKDDSEMQKDFANQSNPIVIEELKNAAYEKYKETIDLMTSLGVEVIMPLDVKDKPIGLMTLGTKETGEMYNDEDLGVLKIVGSQMAIALENALLYEETRKFNIKLKKEIEKATAELREANEQLKKLDEAKSEFISIASHQLRTPLTAIKGYISMMLEGDFGILTEPERTSLEKVFDSNERLIKLVENLLNISRIESGRLQFNYEDVQMEEMVESILYELDQNAKKKGLKIEYKKPPSMTPKVKIDDEKIRQVVMNLTDNAIKYTKQGTVTVSLNYIPPEEVKNKPIEAINIGTPGNYDKGFIEYTVSDSGMGISPEDLPNLFKKFSRGTGTSLVHTEGTGLGLYVARQMIETHHGQIWAESKGEGAGSRFCFRLPIS